MKKALVFFLLLLCSGCATSPEIIKGASSLHPGIDKLAQQLVASADKAKTGRIAVADFIGPDWKVTGLGDHVADKLSVQLFQCGEFDEILERKRLKQMLVEQKTEISGYFDQSTVQQYGHLIGVNSMVIGSIEDLGSVVDITARIIHVGTGEILAMADVRIIKDTYVENLISRARIATLTVSVNPPVFGVVTAMGKEISLQQGTAILTDLPYGPCQVTVSVPGYDPANQTINISHPYESLNLNLESRKFDMRFQIVPPDGDLIVDGEKIEVNAHGFASLPALSARQYSYSAHAEGYENFIGRFNPADEQLVMLELIPKDAFYGLKSEFAKKTQQIEKKFNIRLWSDRTDYKIGDKIVFYFQAERDCYLNLVVINSRGDLTLLFPNRFHRNNFIRAGKTYRIPEDGYGFEFEIQPPIGTDRIYAIADNSPIDIFNNDFEHSAFTAVTRGQTSDTKVRGIGVKLKNTRLNSVAEFVIHIR